MNYRIDFSRLARNEEEVGKDWESKQSLELILDGRASEAMKDYQNSLPEGHILDSIRIFNEESELTGKDILEKYVKPQYPEATLQSWDSFE